MRMAALRGPVDSAYLVEAYGVDLLVVAGHERGLIQITELNSAGAIGAD